MVLIQPLARYFLCPTQKSEITVNTTNNCPVILKVWINRSGPSSPLYLKMNSWKKKDGESSSCTSTVYKHLFCAKCQSQLWTGHCTFCTPQGSAASVKPQVKGRNAIVSRMCKGAAARGFSLVWCGERNQPWLAPPHVVSETDPVERQHHTYPLKSSAHFNQPAAFSAT